MLVALEYKFSEYTFEVKLIKNLEKTSLTFGNPKYEAAIFIFFTFRKI